MNYGIYIGGAFIIWSILLYNEMSIAPMICASAITITGVICHTWRPNNDDE